MKSRQRRGRRAAARFERSIESLEQRMMLSAAVAATKISPLDATPAARYSPPSISQWKSGTYLTGVSSAAPLDIALNYFRSNAALFGVSVADIGSPVVTDLYSDPDGMTHIYFRQQVNGLDIANADANANITKQGRILSFNSAFVAGVGNLAGNKPAVTTLTGTAALLRAADDLAIAHTLRPNVITPLSGSAQIGVLKQSELSTDNIATRLHYVAAPDGLHLAWNYILDVPGGQHWYDTSVDAVTGALLFTADWTSQDDFSNPDATGTTTTASKTTTTASKAVTSAKSTTSAATSTSTSTATPSAAYNASFEVFAYPTKNPDAGSRTLVTNPWDLNASPFGWQDTSGDSAQDSNTTQGNNVSAQDDLDSNNTGGTRPTGGADANNQVYNSPLDLTQAPVNSLNAAITNIYYWDNILHDIHYEYGFTEAAGNFQQNNYGKGGTGNDRVQADAQDGGGTDNANFSSPADGTSGRMQMYVWDFTTPNRDGDYDAQIFVHEYGHGVSNRLTGGPSNASALNALQSGGMGEGWSDFWALMLLQTDGSSATLNGANPVANYSVGENSASGGLRRYPYSFDKSIDPMNFTMYNASTEVHATGEIWTSTLWDMAVLLEKKYGFNPNIAGGYSTPTGSGNLLAIRLVEDALKLQATNPSLTQARDAILQADTNLDGGADLREIWTAFARRGLGTSTVDSSSSATTITNAWDIPASLAAPAITNTGPMSANNLQALSSITFQFSEPINTASFSTAADLTFTSPSGADLMSQISGAVFSNSNKTLTVSFTPQMINGNYTMTIGPNIQAADNGANMDQDLDGTSGEVTDSYTATIAENYRPAADAFGYQASPTTYDGTALTGTTTILDNQDDTSVAIPLGANTFSFYGTTYTANQLFVTENGYLSFGASSAGYNNAQMTFSPSVPIIAPLWDDWATDTTANNDKVVYKLDATNNKLTVQWQSITNRMDGSTGTNTATFSAILSLNTGSNPGDIVFNYTDLSVGTGAAGAAYSNGGSATVGIKAAGLQGANGNNNRLLLSQFSNPNVWLGDTTAIRISATRAAGTVFADDNGNGAIDGGETTVPNATVYADLNNNGVLDPATEPNTLSDGSGNFALGSLPSGSVIVRSSIGPTWIETQPIPQTFTASMGVASTGKNIGVFNDALVGTGAGDSLAISSNGANDRVLMTLNTGGPDHNFSILKSVLPTLSFAGGLGADTVTIDLSNGDPFASFSSRFRFTGAGSDTLATTGAGTFNVNVAQIIDTPTLSLSALGGSTMNLPGALHLAAITVNNALMNFLAGDPSPLVINSLSLVGSGTLDMNDNDMIVFYTGLSPLGGIVASIKSARAGGAWTGSGLFSTSAKNRSPKNTSLGAMERTDYTIGGGGSFDGEPLVGSAVLVKYTYYGDTDFSGRVDGSDYAKIDQKFAQQSTAGNISGWANGDFDSNNQIDGSDYGLMDTAYATQVGIL